MTTRNLALIGAAVFLIQASPAFAECNDIQTWYKLPSGDIKIIIGTQQELPYSISSPDVTSGSPSSPFPPLLSAEEIERMAGKLSKNETSLISYYERVAGNKYRICRRELWLAPDAGTEADRRIWRQASRQYVAANPVLQEETDTHMVIRALMYSYDKKGRIIKIDEGDFSKPEEGLLIRICRRYDDRDRLT